MQSIPKNQILEHHLDTVPSIRQEYNLDKPGRMEDAVRILREWVQKQPHFKKKNFSDYYLETTIVACKGSLERAKRQIERMCTIRTLMPQYFGIFNLKKDFIIPVRAFASVMLPKLTPDHYRVLIMKVNDQAAKMPNLKDLIRSNIIFAEYVKMHDYCRGFFIIADFTEINFTDILHLFNPADLQHALSIFEQGFGMRLKGMHLLSSSKLINSLVTLVKQIVSPKIGSRIHCSSSVDILPDILPVDILPKDYGGKEVSFKELFDKWIDVLSSEEHIEHLKDMCKAGTDESMRPAGDVNNHYASLPGTFRLLNVD